MSIAATTARSGKSSPNGFTQLANGEHLESIVKPEEGLISRRIFADPEIYQMEIDRIFGRGWFFLGHESEIPNTSRFCPKIGLLDNWLYPMLRLESSTQFARAS